MSGDGFVRYSMSFFIVGLILMGVAYVLHLNILGLGLGKRFFGIVLGFGIASLLFAAAFFWFSMKE
jgi:hypothetical protein